MILAVCLNPALDMTYRTGEVRSGASDQIEVVRERAAGLSREQTWPELLGTGIAWSAAAVAMPWAGQVDESMMADVRSQVVVEAL
jgi:fructose-1-phosphate kinase PfkB-like protein